MAIVTSQVESIHGDSTDQRMIYYRFQDSAGAWHRYGPVMTTDPSFDVGAQMAIIADKMAESLAEAEAQALLEQTL